MPAEWRLEQRPAPRSRRATFCGRYSFGVPTLIPEIDRALPPLSARRAAAHRKSSQACADFESRIALSAREHASRAMSRASERRHRYSAEQMEDDPDDDANKESWELEPKWIETKCRWERSVDAADELLTQRQALLQQAAMREQTAATARERAKPRLCDIHGLPFGVQRHCLCSRHEKRCPRALEGADDAEPDLLVCRHCRWPHEDFLGVMAAVEPMQVGDRLHVVQQQQTENGNSNPPPEGHRARLGKSHWKDIATARRLRVAVDACDECDAG